MLGAAVERSGHDWPGGWGVTVARSLATRTAVPQPGPQRTAVSPKPPAGAHRAPESTRTPSADEYARFRPLLFRALALLGRQGYRVDADVGIELVHDFFVVAWAGLR